MMVASDFGLPRTHKILKADAYASALRMRMCAKVGVFALHFCAHQSHMVTSAHPQLGLVVPKKFAKHAVRRNTIKRLSREYFRLNQHQLTSGLWVLRLNVNISNLPLSSVQKRLWGIQIAELFALGQRFAKQYVNGHVINKVRETGDKPIF